MQYIGGVKSFVGVIMPLSNNVFYDELSKGIEDAIAPHDLIPAISYSQEDESQENILLTSMQEKGFAGVIAVLLNSRAHSFDALSAKNFCAGYISQADFKPNQCSLAVDHVWGGHIGIEYLHSLGHNRIVWVAGPDHHGQLSARLIGITQTASVAGTTALAAVGVGASFDAAGVNSATVAGVTDTAAVDTAQAAADAAAEATDAANAATDAANAAAEAADAATAAAQDAADAVAALSAQVADLISGLKAQLTALTNLVIKIQKKVKA